MRDARSPVRSSKKCGLSQWWWAAIRSALESGSIDAVGNDERSISITRLIATSPSLIVSIRGSLGVFGSRCRARVAAKGGPMRGVVFLGNRKLEIREFPDPKPGPGEVVVAMKASGMCGSDLHPYRAAGNAAASLGLGGSGGPVIAGHEPCGVVAERGSGV